ncbi:MAG: [FeFe] hydrogenase, group A [Clostridiales bacterium]|nr:[FeFe] hydrogenase, group A [Clostridiales bacterium]
MREMTLYINKKKVTVPEGTTIMEAAAQADIEIPALCWLKDINEDGACLICQVEAIGKKDLIISCKTKVEEGMEVTTNSPRVIAARKNTLRLLLSGHEKKCLSCVRSGYCELQKLCEKYGIEDDTYYEEGERQKYELDISASHMVRDNNKCILCRRCVAVCKNVQGIGVIGTNSRGCDSYIGSAFDLGLGQTSCVSCGQCIAVCPTGALYEKDATEAVFRALADSTKVVIAQTAPAVRAALGECFGLPAGTDTEGKMVAALRELGFDKVFDTDLGADLTIMEEANEFLERMKSGKNLPLITSCSPGWVTFCEYYFPEMLDNLSTCKSPHEMLGAMIKTYYGQKNTISPEDIVVVSIMPCTAKKVEIGREGMDASGVQDVDYVLTTRELSRMIKKRDINFLRLENAEFDDPLGISTGAGVIFGASGGVMEAALRTAVESLQGEELSAVEFHQVRGMEGIKEAELDVSGQKIRVAAVSGLANARKILEAVADGSADYHFIEIMGCPGGCINGGGQPQVPAAVRNFTDYRKLRAQVLYQLDEDRPLRKSHDNPMIQKLYQDFIGEPGGSTAHKLLHTKYRKRELY